MKTAQVAPLMTAVPQKFYGGTERLVSYLTDALVAMGYDVTLFPKCQGRQARSGLATGAAPRSDHARLYRPARGEVGEHRASRR